MKSKDSSIMMRLPRRLWNTLMHSSILLRSNENDRKLFLLSAKTFIRKVITKLREFKFA